MIYNGVTEYLIQRCREWAEEYRRRYLLEWENMGQSLLFVKWNFFEEMEFKLASLVDWQVDSFGSYREQVCGLVPVRKAYVLRNEWNPDALALLRDVEAEFLSFLNGVAETDSIEPERYLRVILGEEQERLEYDILEKWGYCADYWYPLKGSFDENKLFLNVDFFEPYWERFCALLGLPQERLYEYGESSFDDGQLCEVDEITGYGGLEAAYLPKDLSWIIYFSHENTVTFAGTILPMVKELLEPEQEYWNKWN